MFGKNKQEANEMEVIEDEAQEVAESIEQPVNDDEENEIVEEIKAEEDSDDNYVEIVVVKELPVEQVRFTTREDGTRVEFMTTEEALGKILNS